MTPLFDCSPLPKPNSLPIKPYLTEWFRKHISYITSGGNLVLRNFSSLKICFTKRARTSICFHRCVRFFAPGYQKIAERLADWVVVRKINFCSFSNNVFHMCTGFCDSSASVQYSDSIQTDGNIFFQTSRIMSESDKLIVYSLKTFYQTYFPQSYGRLRPIVYSKYRLSLK